MLESNFQSKIIAFLKTLTNTAFKLMVANVDGYPDIHFTYNGKCHFIEVKVGYNKLSELQSKRINDINAAGGKAMVLYNDDNWKEQIINFINN